MKKIFIFTLVLTVLSAEAVNFEFEKKLIGYTFMEILTLKEIRKSNDGFTTYLYFDEGYLKSKDLSARLLISVPMTKVYLFKKHYKSIGTKIIHGPLFRIYIDREVIDIEE